MSGTNLLNHGVYDIAKPDLLLIKANLAGFQCKECISGIVAAPTSPIAPALESGVIVKKGTADVIVFKLSPKDVCGSPCPIKAWTDIKSDKEKFKLILSLSIFFVRDFFLIIYWFESKYFRCSKR